MDDVSRRLKRLVDVGTASSSSATKTTRVIRRNRRRIDRGAAIRKITPVIGHIYANTIIAAARNAHGMGGELGDAGAITGITRGSVDLAREFAGD